MTTPISKQVLKGHRTAMTLLGQVGTESGRCHLKVSSKLSVCLESGGVTTTETNWGRGSKGGGRKVWSRVHRELRRLAPFLFQSGLFTQPPSQALTLGSQEEGMPSLPSFFFVLSLVARGLSWCITKPRKVKDKEKQKGCGTKTKHNTG